MKTNKNKLALLSYTIHKWSGLYLAFFVIMVGITGALLVWIQEIRTLTGVEQQVTAAPCTVGLDSLFYQIINLQKGNYINGINIRNGQRQAFQFDVYNNKEQYGYTVNQFTGKILHIAHSKTELSNIIYSLHTSLYCPPYGDVLVAIAAWLFGISTLTGIYLQRKYLFRVFKVGIRTNKSEKAKYSDLHKLTGTVSLFTNLILSGTAIFISLYAFDLSNLKEGNTKPTPKNQAYHFSLQSIVDDSKTRIEGFTPAYIGFPWKDGNEINIYGKIPYGNALYTPAYESATVIYSIKDGHFIGKKDLRKESLSEQASYFAHEFHYGKYNGIFVKIIYTLGGLLPTILAISGVMVWRRKGKKRYLSTTQTS